MTSLLKKLKKVSSRDSSGNFARRSAPYLAAIFIASIAGYSVDIVLDSWLIRENLEIKTRQINEDRRREVVPGSLGTSSPSLQDFVASNPFGVLSRVKEEKVVKGKVDSPKATIGGMDDLKLVGTLPGIGVRIKSGKDMLFMLLGQDYGGYTLKQAESGFAVFAKEDTEYLLPLLYSGAKEKTADTSSGNVSSGTSVNSSSYGQYQVSAPEDGNSGEVPRELLNQLLMSPFDELKKVRLRATFKDDEPLGMQVQWIANDSILKELGVQKGDIVSSVNGIPMNNMGDISNAINSLMDGSRFDVEVLRDGEQVPLSYVVR